MGTRSKSSAEEEASEVAQKAFNWQQNKMDISAAHKIKAKILASKKQAFRAKEQGYKQLKVREVYQKKKARTKKAKQMQKHATWEVAAKAYSSVEQGEEDHN